MYKCECGKEFENSQSFNGHKCHCKTHLATKYEDVDKFITEHSKKCTAHNVITNKKRAEINNIEREKNLQTGISEKHMCEHCKKIMIKKFGSGRFCCRSCANSHKHSEETKQKISAGCLNHLGSSLISREIQAQKYRVLYSTNPKICKCCGKPIPYDLRKRKTCSDICAKTLKDLGALHGGQASAAKIHKRSKNEIYFCELCERYFKNVKHNEPIFNGGDADIIIEDIKYAVLGNGKGHYEQVFSGQSNSLKQIQNRDKLKINEIKKCNYIPYIIKDLGKYNKAFVENEFNKLLNLLKIS